MTYTVEVVRNAAPSTLTDFVDLVDLASMPNGWWTDTTTDLGNVRVYAADGVTQLPFDIAVYDRTAKTGRLWVRCTLTTSTSTIVVKTVNGATALATNATYGRDACWVDYEVVIDLHGSTADRTGKNGSLTLTGTAAVSGGQLVGDGSSNCGAYIDTASTSVWSYATNADRVDTTQRNVLDLSDSSGTSSTRAIMAFRGGNTYSLWNSTDSWLGSGQNPAGDTRLLGTHNGTTNRKIYTDGVLRATDTTISARSATRLHVGRPGDGTSTWNGTIGNLPIYKRHSIPTDDWVAQEYGRWTTPTSYYTINDIGASSDPTGTITSTLPTLAGALDGNYGPTGTVTGALPALSGDFAGSLSGGILDGTLPTLSGDLAGDYSAPGVSGDITGALPALSGDLAGVYSETGVLAGTLPALTGDLVGVLPVNGALAGDLPALTGDLAGDFGSGEPNPYHELVLADDPLWYFKLDEPTGTLTNSVTGSTATLTKVGTVDQGEPGAAPALGLGVGVSGPGADSLLVTGGSEDSLYNFAVEFWYKGTDDEAIIVCGTNSTDTRAFVVGVGTIPNGDETGTAGAPYVGVVDGIHSRGVQADAVIINDGLWHHVLGSVDGDPFSEYAFQDFRLWVDGVRISDHLVSDGFSFDCLAPWPFADAEWTFGADALAADGATGDVDELALYPFSYRVNGSRVPARYLASGAAPYGSLAGTLSPLTGAFAGFPMPTLPALTGAFVVDFSHPIATETADSANGRNRTGYALMTVTYPLAATPVTVQPIRVLAQSVPEQVMSGGRPV